MWTTFVMWTLKDWRLQAIELACACSKGTRDWVYWACLSGWSGGSGTTPTPSGHSGHVVLAFANHHDMEVCWSLRSRRLAMVWLFFGLSKRRLTANDNWRSMDRGAG
eukprot:4473077-Amphidinium_carterae.1